MWMFWIKQIWNFSSNPKNIKDSEVLYMDSQGTDPNLWGSIYVTIVTELFFKKIMFWVFTFISFVEITSVFSQRFLIK